MATPTPFIYDRPVRGDEFLNRKQELSFIFGGLYHGVSTVISGAPRIGKTSLLLKLTDSTTQRKYLGDEVDQFLFVFIDLNLVDKDDYTPSTFWKEALSKLRAYPEDYAHLVAEAARDGYSSWPLEQLFEHLGEQGLRLVLLLDEFEWLLIHPNFQDAMFFAFLRHLATVTGGLAIVAASRFSVAEMNQQGRTLLTVNSPLFNHMSEVRLRPFDEKTVDLLLLSGAFEPSARAFIRRVAGGHPFLLQAMAATLLETTDDNYLRAAESAYERIAYHFDELWYLLDDDTRTTALILSLLEFSDWINNGLNIEEIEKVDIFGPELSKLAELGLAEQVSIKGGEQKGLVWRGERWRVGTQAFAWWVREEVIAETLWVPISYSEWLHHKQYRFLLTQAQSDWLLSTVPNTPLWTARGAESRTFFKAFLKGK